MTSAGVTPGCGWTGSIPSKAPLAVAWDGTVEPVQGVYADGAAAQLGFLVTMANGRTVGAALPIWVSSTGGNDGRCAGGRRRRRGAGCAGGGRRPPRPRRR